MFLNNKYINNTYHPKVSKLFANDNDILIHRNTLNYIEYSLNEYVNKYSYYDLCYTITKNLKFSVSNTV